MQLELDFSEAAELVAHLESRGLMAAEVKIVVAIWQHGTLADNRTAIAISQPKLARLIGYSVSWTRTALDDLQTFGVVEGRQPAAGKPKIYVVDWSHIRAMPAIRAVSKADVFAAFDAARPASDPATTPAVTPTATLPETLPVGVPVGVPATTAPQPQIPNESPPQIPQPQITAQRARGSGPPNWGRTVAVDELRGWPGRRRLFELACQINGEIDPDDYDDVVGFVAAVLCCLQPGRRNPVGMLLDFVRRRAWRHRGRGGVDGFWISKATQALRELRREQQMEPMHQ